MTNHPECLIEIFDPDHLKDNITGCMHYHPAHFYIFIQDDIREHKRRGLHSFLAKYCPQTTVHEIMIQEDGTDEIRDLVNVHMNHICNSHEEILVEIMGGEALLNVAVFYDAFARGLPIVSIDRAAGKISDWSDAREYAGDFEPEDISIDGIVRLNGGYIERTMHKIPKPEQERKVLELAKYILEHEKEFTRFTAYLHACLHNNELGQNLKVKTSNEQKVGDKTVRANPLWFKRLTEGSLLKDVKLDENQITFSFSGQFSKESLLIRGSWLELYIYLRARVSGAYDEVLESVVLDWNSESKKETDIRNEIDVILRKGDIPIFISCKMRKAQSQDLNEIKQHARHFGGEEAKALVASANTTNKDITILKRAEEMGMHVITREEMGLEL